MTAKSKETETLQTCPQWITFRANLKAAGVALRPLWSVHTGRTRAGDDLFLYAIGPISLPIEKQAHSTMIVQHYGEGNGFGLWLDARSHDLDGQGIDEVIRGYQPAVTPGSGLASTLNDFWPHPKAAARD